MEAIRKRIRECNKYDLVFYLCLTLFAITSLSVFMDYGIGFDGPRQKTYGEAVLNYYLSGFKDKTAFSYINLYLYGGLFDMLAALLCKFSFLGAYETRHLLNGLVGVLGVFGCWKLTRLLAGTRAALFAALLLMFTPSYFGHMFMNPKDIPFAVGYVWSMYYILLLFRNMARIKPSLVLRLGLVLGLTLAIRIGGVLMVVYTCLGFGMYVLFPGLFGDDIADPKDPIWKRWVQRAWRPAIALLAAFFIAYSVMLVFWPWAQHKPLHNPLHALIFMSKFADWPGTVLMGGEYVDAMNLPASYLPRYFGVKLPEALYFAFMLGLIALPMTCWKKIKCRCGIKSVTLFAFLIFSMLFPMAYAILKHSVLYDGIRHFMFVIPLLCVVGGVGLDTFLRIYPSRFSVYFTGAGLALLLGWQGFAMQALHPDEYVYYNIFAGWPTGANNHYEMDYWAISYREAVAIVEDYARKRDGASFAGRKYNIYVDGPYLSATYYFPANFTLTLNPDEADFFFTHTRWELDKKLPGRRIASVRKMGVDLTVINAK